MNKHLNTTIIGAGLIGARRAKCASAHEASRVSRVVDIDADRARTLAEEIGCAYSTSWEEAAADPETNIVVVSTINKLLLPIASAALKNGKHVLIEKPMCRNLGEAQALYELAKNSAGALKIGFNHRYHPALTQLKRMLDRSELGEVMFLRSIYGHGGRPGYDKEWRASKDLSGGGELLDQGVHIADLINWMIGPITRVFGDASRFFWDLGALEDNAFAILTSANGVKAAFQTSWTQWKNRFRFEVYGTKGSAEIDGLGGSYGKETLTVATRSEQGGAPALETTVFDGPDDSWALEWSDFIGHILNKTAYWGAPEDGLAAMRIIDGIYSSSASRAEISIAELKG